MKSQFLAAVTVLACAVGAAWTGASPQAPATAADWRVAEAVRYENLSVFPVLAAKPADTAGFVTLDEALASGDAVITELGGEILRRSRDGREPEAVRLPWPDAHPQTSAEVNRLVLVNRGSKPLLLLAGEIVSGGKQDRVVAKDRIVPSGAEPLPLDVFCVERGRWSSGTAFMASGLIAHPSVREQAAVAGDQQAVWAAVRRGTTAEPAAEAAPESRPVIVASELSSVMGREARTESYARIYKGSRIGQSVESFAAEVERRFARATEKQEGRVVGIVVAYGGELAWADVFASAELFARYWPKLVRSYSVEALARRKSQEQVGLEEAREFLKPLRGTITTESEPGVYVWRQVREGRYVEIALEALTPRELTLHWVKIARTR